VVAPAGQVVQDWAEEVQVIQVMQEVADQDYALILAERRHGMVVVAVVAVEIITIIPVAALAESVVVELEELVELDQFQEQMVQLTPEVVAEVLVKALREIMQVVVAALELS
jgi:acyl CoA:acetate/3-ketoacid CoA transferase alpha subunit